MAIKKEGKSDITPDSDITLTLSVHRNEISTSIIHVATTVYFGKWQKGMGNISILSYIGEPTRIVSWWFYNYRHIIFTLLVVLLHEIRHKYLKFNTCVRTQLI